MQMCWWYWSTWKACWSQLDAVMQLLVVVAVAIVVGADETIRAKVTRSCKHWTL